MGDLWTAYVGGDPPYGGLAPFFTHRPGDWASATKARDRAATEPLDAAAIRETVGANERWGVHPSVVERIAQLGLSETRVIATGQQAGLLGGPLLTLYKAIAAVRWAERLERDLGVPVVAVFWVASEDHDLDEVRSFRWRDAEDAWQEFTYRPAQHRPGMPIHDVAVEPVLRDDLEEIFARVRQSEFTAVLAERLDAIASEASDLEGFFVAILAWLLGERAPVFVSPRMRWVRRGAAALLDQELAQPGESSSRVIEAGNRLSALHFRPQLRRRPEQVNCFVHYEGLRHRITIGGGTLEITAPTGERWKVGTDRLRADLASEPDSFSLNVVTRPIVQDYLLPTLAYLAGPGEVGYFAQMRGVYELFDVPMPMLLPRPRVCLIEPRAERALARLGVAVEPAVAQSADRFEVLIEQASRQAPVEERLDAAQRRMNEAVEFIGSRVDLTDPAIARSFQKLTGMVETGLEKLAERQRRAALSANAEKMRAVAAVRELLWPDGLPQERALTIFFPFLNLFGECLVKRLAETIRLDATDIQPIVLSSLMGGQGKT